MNFRVKSLILLITISQIGCSMLDHRDYEMVMNERFDDEMWIPERDFDVVPGDSGRSYRNNAEIFNRVPATARDAKELNHQRSLHEELMIKENKLSEVEYEDYRKIKHLLGSTSQKIYFLSLTYPEKLAYIQARNISVKKSYTAHDLYSGNITDQKPIGIGMSKADVINTWGRPADRQFSGNPSDQNEKWAYNQGGVTKYIYFEHGHVEGWTEQ